MAGVTSPTLRRRELGALLRELRRAADLTVEDVAGRLLCSAAKISRLETGQRNIGLRDVRDLCDVYGVPPTERERLMNLARESRQSAWWQQYDLGNLGTYIGLEAAASSISDYDPAIVPGLIQTEDYARAIMHGSIWPKLDPRQIEPRIEARLTRQAVLTRSDPPPPRVWSVVDEAALRRVVGGPDVMHEQLRRLIEVAALPNVTVQVIPLSIGAHPALDSTFTIMAFAEPAVADVVYVEGLVGEIFLERPADLDRYRQVFDHLRAMALGPKDSIAFIDTIDAEYRAATT